MKIPRFLRLPVALCACTVSFAFAHADNTAVVAGGAAPTTASTSGSLQPIWPPNDAFPGVGHPRTTTYLKDRYNMRRPAFRANVAASHGKVVFYGDSITEFSGMPKNCDPKLWFPKFPSVNRGISADTTHGLLYRLDEDVLALDPRAVVVLIGTNDLADKNTPEDVAANIETLLKKMRAAKPKMPIFLCKLMPRGNKAGISFPGLITAVNEKLEKIAATIPNVTICDTWTPFDDGTGICKKEEFPDMLHPNQAGYLKWIGALTPLLEKTLGK